MENNTWKEYKIAQIAELVQGLALNKKTNHLIKDSGLPLLRIKDLLENKEEIYIDEINVPQKCIVNKEQLIMTRTGQVGYVFLGKEGVLHNNSFKILLDKTLCYTPFIFWYFNTETQREYLTNISAGSVQPDLTHKIFNEVTLKLPPLPEQKAIASVLSSLDDKIDLLHQQNQTLEALAETLFRQWFIEEAKEDWEEVKLGDIIQTTSGYNHKQVDISLEGDILLSMGSIIKQYGINIESSKKIFNPEIDNRFVCNVGDIIITTRDVTQNADLLGSPGIIPGYLKNKIVIVGSNLYKLTNKSSRINNLIIYQLLKSNIYREYVKGVASGTSILMLKKSDLDLFKFKIPSEIRLKQIEKKILDIYLKVDLNYSIIKNITEIRDTLLPKLMSGEVRVKL